MFEIQLFKAHVKHKSWNSCISPYGIKTMLYLLLNVADDRNVSIIQAALGKNGTLEELNDEYYAQYNKLNGFCDPKGTGPMTIIGFPALLQSIKIKNEVLISDSLKFKPKFKKLLETYFNFTKMDPNPLLAKEELSFFNKTKFKASWCYPFAKIGKKVWHERNWSGYTGEDYETEFIQTESTYIHYYKLENCTVVSIPYYGDCRFIAILPDEGVEVDSILTEEIFKTIDSDPTKQYQVTVEMPEMDIHYHSDLQKTLTEMGMGRVIYGPISGITDKDLVMEDMSQECSIKIDEKGTEAVALTRMSMVSISNVGFELPAPPEKVKVVLDRAFAYMVYSSYAKEVLFMGVIERV